MHDSIHEGNIFLIIFSQTITKLSTEQFHINVHLEAVVEVLHMVFISKLTYLRCHGIVHIQISIHLPYAENISITNEQT